MFPSEVRTSVMGLNWADKHGSPSEVRTSVAKLNMANRCGSPNEVSIFSRGVIELEA